MAKPKQSKKDKETEQQIKQYIEEGKILMQVCKTKEQLAYYAIVAEHKASEEEKCYEAINQLLEIAVNMLPPKQRAEFDKIIDGIVNP